jgi:hypothetical protein
VTALVVTAALLGLCADVAAAPMDVLTRIIEFDEMPAAVSGDLDFPAAMVGQELVFDPYSEVPDDSDSDFLVTLPLTTTLKAPEPPAVLLFPLAWACLALFVTVRRLARLLRGLKRSSRPGRRKVRREFRMMA